MKRSGFTILEVLLATVLAALLLGGVLGISATLARDERRLRRAASDDTGAAADAAVEMIRWDLANASDVTGSRDGREIVLVGHGSLDPETLRPTNRLARVVYAIRPGVGLLRQQRYLDDAARPRPWSDLVLSGATRVEASTNTRGRTTVHVRLDGGKSLTLSTER
jgi:type II secretory pathway pseudopilin PulG